MKPRIIIGVAVELRFLVAVFPSRRWSFCWWLG
mgnify:CR=1 FL=1